MFYLYKGKVMVIDSYEKLKKMISEKRDVNPSLLLHCCCAPCSSYVLDLLKEAFDITIYYYNPNIYPENEFEIRYEEFNKLGLFKIVKADFYPKEFYDAIKGHELEKEGSERCFKCYNLRLEHAAVYASKNNFDYFSTALSISPYKNSNKINEIGQNLANIYNVKFLYSNFKKEEGYKKSIVLSKEFDLYRQDYCGCIFSYKEAQIRKQKKESHED